MKSQHSSGQNPTPLSPTTGTPAPVISLFRLTGTPENIRQAELIRLELFGKCCLELKRCLEFSQEHQLEIENDTRFHQALRGFTRMQRICDADWWLAHNPAEEYPLLLLLLEIGSSPD